MKIITILLLVLPVMLMAEEVELPSFVKDERKAVKAIEKLNEDIKEAKKSFDNAMKEAHEEYVDEMDDVLSDLKKDLEKDLQKEMKKGNLEGANQIQDKIKEIEEFKSKLKPNDLFSQSNRPKVIHGGKEIDISSGWGKELESVKKGQSIFIQYIEGKWRSPHESDLESPEETLKPHLKLALYARINKDNKFEMLKVISNTSEVFTYEFENDYQMVMLAPQINTDKVPNWNIMHQNTGNVKYKVGFSR